MLKNFRTYQLSVNFYRATQTTQLPCHLRDQLQRAASSICLNLAEGYGRISPRDKLRFFAISMGSVRECQALLDLAITDPENSQLLDAVAASLYRLIKVMQTRA